MTAERLYQLGLFVRRSPAGVEADLPLENENLVNPYTGQPLAQASFILVGERLIVLDPPELVGLPPLGLGEFNTAGQIRTWMAADYKRLLSELERRCSELRQLGVAPHVDPTSLRLRAVLGDGALELELASDRRGQLQLAGARRHGQPLALPQNLSFELSEFRDAWSLFDHLCTRAGLEEAQPAPRPPLAEGTVPVSWLLHAFGPGAVLPPRGALELLAEVRVRGHRFRFAAARVQGTLFRGLLAGPQGRLWANDFDLATFGGLTALVAEQLGVAPHEVEFPQAQAGEG
jgi:hypothetical protein